MSWVAEAVFEQALASVRGRDYDRAQALLVECLLQKPDFAEAWVMRGNIALAQERWFDALLHFDRAIDDKPDAFDAWNNRGTALANLGRWDDAEAAFRRSAEIMPAREPHMGLANMFCTLMRLEEAAAEYRAALSHDPGDYEARFNLGVTLLGLGQWEEGFPAYAARLANTPHPPAASRFPRWQGEDLAGKTILLYPEQGYGDEILASRFASLLGVRYGCDHIVLEARVPFLRLARTLPDVGRVVARGDPFPPEIDYSLPLLDVPMVLGLEPRGLPLRTVPDRYLQAPGRSGFFADRIARQPATLNVGLCWGSGKHLDTVTAARAMKSIPIGKLAGLALPGVRLVSLQKPAEPTPAEMRVVDWTDELDDLADTAELIEALDLIITVDTAVAHLAGALGKPVWNFVRFSGYWPWLAPGVAGDPAKSIWYPSMQLYRQPALNDWTTPIAKAVNDLANLVMEKAA